MNKKSRQNPLSEAPESDILPLYMPDTGLPQATSAIKNFKIGNIQVKTEEPTETFQQVKNALDSLEKAAKENVFHENAEPDK